MRMAEIQVPDSSVATVALAVSRRYHSPALVNHCVRAYLFAASFGDLTGIEYDAELLYVASTLHDIGLTANFDSHEVPFEYAGGEVVWVFAAGAGWTADRCTRAAGIVVAHMQDAVDPKADPEGHLLELSTGLDISGRDQDAWPEELRREIVAAHPRLDLADEFIRCFDAQAARKPGSTAALAVESGIAGRMASNPLDGI